MAKKILFLDSNHPSMMELLRAKGFACEEDYSSPKEAVEKKLSAYHGVVIRSRFRLDRQFLDAGTNLECIGRAGAGMENIDVAYAESKGFDVSILAYDKYKTGFGNEYVKESSPEEIHAHADVLSLHVPLTDETKFMVNESFLQAFAKPIWLLNTSRGKVLDTAALAAALKSGKVVGAGLDVLEYEAVSFEQLGAETFPQPFRDLCDSDRVILSPHVAGWTVESHRKIAEVLAGKMIDALQAEKK
jgi:phosphoglycerate dehydrogenase-like enzyme